MSQEQRSGVRDGDAARRPVVGDKERRRREDEKGNQGKAPNADKRRGLHHQWRWRQGVAESVPRKARQEMAVLVGELKDF